MTPSSSKRATESPKTDKLSEISEKGKGSSFRSSRASSISTTVPESPRLAATLKRNKSNLAQYEPVQVGKGAYTTLIQKVEERNAELYDLVTKISRAKKEITSQNPDSREFLRELREEIFSDTKFTASRKLRNFIIEGLKAHEKDVGDISKKDFQKTYKRAMNYASKFIEIGKDRIQKLKRRIEIIEKKRTPYVEARESFMAIVVNSGMKLIPPSQDGAKSTEASLEELDTQLAWTRSSMLTVRRRAEAETSDQGETSEAAVTEASTPSTGTTRKVNKPFHRVAIGKPVIKINNASERSWRERFFLLQQRLKSNYDTFYIRYNIAAVNKFFFEFKNELGSNPLYTAYLEWQKVPLLWPSIYDKIAEKNNYQKIRAADKKLLNAIEKFIKTTHVDTGLPELTKEHLKKLKINEDCDIDLRK